MPFLFSRNVPIISDSRFEKDAGNKANWYFFLFFSSRNICKNVSIVWQGANKKLEKKYVKGQIKEVHKHDKLRIRKKRQQKKLMTLRKLNEKTKTGKDSKAAD